MNLSKIVYKFVKPIAVYILTIITSCSGLDFPEVSDVVFYSMRGGGIGANALGYYNGTDQISIGTANGLESSDATSVLARDGKIIYAYLPLVGLSVSKDAGESFTTKPGAEDVTAKMYYSKGRLFIFGSSGAWLTEDDGDSFETIELPVSGNSVAAVSGNTILIGYGSFLYKSTNSGKSFTLLENTPFTNISVLQLKDSKYLVGDSNGMHVSNNKGADWNSVSSTDLNGPVTSAQFVSGDIYVITGDSVTNNLYISGDGGRTYGRQSDWEGFNGTLPYHSLTVSEKLVGVLHGGGVCTAEKNGRGKPVLPFICIIETGFANPTDLYIVDGRLDLGR